MVLLQPPAIPEVSDYLDGFSSFSGDFLMRTGFDVLVVGILILGIYYRIYRRSDLFLTFFTFNIIIFLITYLLNKIQMSIGAAFGLFAVFSMLRYRTQGISAKDMTYLFLVISIGLITAVNPGGWLSLVFIDAILLVSTQLLEGNYLFRREYSKSVQYNHIDYIRPEQTADLILDLQRRTGLPVHRVEIHSIDFVKESVQLTLYYYQHANNYAIAATREETDLESPVSVA